MIHSGQSTVSVAAGPNRLPVPTSEIVLTLVNTMIAALSAVGKMNPKLVCVVNR